MSRRIIPRMAAGFAVLTALLFFTFATYDRKTGLLSLDGSSLPSTVARLVTLGNGLGDGAVQAPARADTWQAKIELEITTEVVVADEAKDGKDVTADITGATRTSTELSMDLCKHVVDKNPVFRNDTRPFKGLPENEIIGLPSYPRSGNSLTRLLLERMTGVYTGSIYCVRSNILLGPNLKK